MDKLEREKRLVSQMIDIYSLRRHNEAHNSFDAAELKKYAVSRLEHCRYGNGKPACKNCPVHCYSLERRRQIRRVMRLVGPRIFLYHPSSTLKHLFGL